MLLNHKEALDFIIETPDYLRVLSISKIEDIHSLLVKELAIEKNFQKAKARRGAKKETYKQALRSATSWQKHF